MRRMYKWLSPVRLLVLVSSLVVMWTYPPDVAGAWGVQVNRDGFGLPNCNSTWAMVNFGGELYAGTGNPGKLFRTDGTVAIASDRYEWDEVTLPTTFDSVGEFEIDDIEVMATFETPDGPRLYVAASGVNSSENQDKNVLFSSSDGREWHPVGVWD